jgi:hypothetical protein
VRIPGDLKDPDPRTLSTRPTARDPEPRYSRINGPHGAASGTSRSFAEARRKARGRQPAKGRAGVRGGEGKGALGLELVDEQVAGTQPQCAFRCGLSAPAPLAHFTTAGARQPGIHPEMDVVTCRAGRHEPVCVACRAPRSARPRRTPALTEQRAQ